MSNTKTLTTSTNTPNSHGESGNQPTLSNECCFQTSSHRATSLECKCLVLLCSIAIAIGFIMGYVCSGQVWKSEVESLKRKERMMRIACCGCEKIKVNGKWYDGVWIGLRPVSHHHCPDCKKKYLDEPLKKIKKEREDAQR